MKQVSKTAFSALIQIWIDATFLGKTVNHCSEGRQPPADGIDNIFRMDGRQKSQNLKSQNRLSKSLKYSNIYFNIIIYYNILLY